MKRRTTSTQGLTLLELLVVIALMGVASTLGGRVLLGVTDNWRQISVRAELDAMAEGVFDRMGKDFSDILSADVSGVPLVGMTQDLEDSPDHPDAPMSDDRVIIPIRTSTGPTQVSAGARVMYRVEPEDGRRLLVQTVGDLMTDLPIGGRVALIPQADVLRLRIDYADKAGRWLAREGHEGWYRAALPRAVRVSLTLAHQDRPFDQVARSKVFLIHVD